MYSGTGFDSQLKLIFNDSVSHNFSFHSHDFNSTSSIT